MDPVKVYFSDKQLQRQINYIFGLLKIPIDDEYYNLCAKIVRSNNKNLFDNYINKKPANVSLQYFLQRLNKKSSLDSAKIFYEKISQNNVSASNGMDGFAPINTIGQNSFGQFMSNDIQMARMMPKIQTKEQEVTIEERLKRRDLEDRMLGLTNRGMQAPISTDPSIFLENCDENRKARQHHQQQQMQQMNNQLTSSIIPQTQQSQQNNLMGGFLAPDILESNQGMANSGISSLNAIGQPLIDDQMKQQMQNMSNRPVNIQALQQQRQQEINIPINPQGNYMQQMGDFKEEGVNDSPSLTNKNLIINCSSKQLIQNGKPKNMFSIRATNNNLNNISMIKLLNFNALPESYNINNENNKVNIILNGKNINLDIKPNNYDLSELLNTLNEQLIDFIFEFTDDYHISIKYIEQNIVNNKDEIKSFIIQNSINSIFRVLGFTNNRYSGEIEYLSEEQPNLPKTQPFYVFMIINNNKMYKFNINNIHKIYRKKFKELIPTINNLTFMFKQSNNQMYDCNRYIDFDIEFDFD